MRAQLALTGLQKAAFLLISLGPQRSAEVLAQFDEDEMERFTREIAITRTVPPDARAEIFAECYSRIGGKKDMLAGGQEYAKEVLIRTLGERKATELLERVFSNRIAPFVFMEDGDPLQIANFLRDEHPQTIAVVLSHLSGRQAAAVLSNLGPELQADVAMRIATMSSIAPEVLTQIEHGLQKKFATVLSQDYSVSGGPDFLVTMLTQIDRTAEKTIMEHIEDIDDTLAEEIRSKMFVFEDIVQLDNKSVQRVLQDVDRGVLARAMKSTTNEVRDLIFSNMSSRAREMLQEEIDLLGAIRLSTVEQAQRSVTDTIRLLETKDEIIIARGEDKLVA